MIQSLIEEADAINWYEQRMSVEKDDWKKIINNVISVSGDIVENAEKAEKKVD